MDNQLDRRLDSETRVLVEKAITFKDTVGRSGAVAFLVEHHVPPPVLQRVLMDGEAADNAAA